MVTEASSARRYEVTIDPGVETSHTRVLRLISPGSKVLDLGCATGALGEALRKRGCTVIGVEVDPGAAAIARTRCDAVLELDLEQADLSALAEHAPFDAVIAADVLEHLVHPGGLLGAIAPLLSRDGYLVTSIPNVAHGSVRLALLAGEFPYSDTGLLDATHLRFYTRASMAALLAENGFSTVYVEDQTHDAEAGEALDGIDLEALPAEARAAVRNDPESGVYQFVAVSTPGPPSGLASALQRLGEQLRDTRAQGEERAAELALQLAGQVTATQHLEDELLRSQAEALAAREEVLAGRRAQVLAEVQAASDQARIQALEAHTAMLAGRLPAWEAMETKYEATRAELEAIHRSKLWRLGTLYRRLLGNRLARR